MNTLFVNAVIYTLDKPSFAGWLLTEGKTIDSFGKGAAPEYILSKADQVIDAEGKNLLPGLIDIHTHGCLGICTMDADPETQLKVARHHARHGVTTYLPTTMTDNTEMTLKAIQTINGLVGKRGDFAKIPGIHLEGPFLNAAKCGAQDTANIRPGTIEESKKFLDAGVIKRIAIAPEIEGNLKVADLFASQGISIAAGHTAAGYDELNRALEHGFRGITHLFNGMAAFGHREPGTIGGALAIPDYVCELICDNIHSHPAAHWIAWKAKGRYGIALITDSIRPAGLPDGTYTSEFTGQTIVVSCNGTNLRIPSGALAGSALTMERALKNFTENVGATLDETWPCSSYNAARAIGIDHETGSIEKGKLADLILLDAGYNVSLTMIEGDIVCKEG